MSDINVSIRKLKGELINYLKLEDDFDFSDVDFLKLNFQTIMNMLLTFVDMFKEMNSTIKKLANEDRELIKANKDLNKKIESIEKLIETMKS